MDSYARACQIFMETYKISEKDKLFTLYDVFTLNSFLPAKPTMIERAALQQVFGATDASNFMEYTRLSNSYELINQWKKAYQELLHSDYVVGPDA